MLKIGIDFDDVLAKFTDVACQLCNEENGTTYTEADITEWGYDTCPAAKDVSKYYDDIRVYERQTVTASAKFFMRTLRTQADVYIMTAVKPEKMSFRAKQIKDAFPDFPDDHILMGTAKNLVKFDIMLDDGPHNILKSCADFPVLFRRPWNHSLSGLLAVNNYEEFLVLLNQIKRSYVEDVTVAKRPTVIALVGPSGSGKKQLADKLCEAGVAKRLISVKDDDKKNFDEDYFIKTIYGGHKYQLSETAVDACLGNGDNVVVPVDMCGAMALKRKYPTVLVFCKRHREDMIMDILERDISNKEKQIRLLSIEQELKHERLCDITADMNDPEEGVKTVLKVF